MCRAEVSATAVVCHTPQQGTLAGLGGGANGNFMKVNKAKYKVLHLDWGNPRHTRGLGGEGTESNPAEKDFGVMVMKNST